MSGKYKPAQCFIEQGATLAGYLPSVNSVDCTNKELVFNFGLADQRYQMIIASAQGTVGEAAIINIGLPQVVMPAGIQAQYYNGPSSFNLTQIN